MRKIKYLALLLFFCLISEYLFAQIDSVSYRFGATALSSTGVYAPFWLHSNQYGAVSERGSSFTTSFAFSKNMNRINNDFDYGYGFQSLFLNDNQKSELIPQEYYIKARWKVLGLRVGAMREHYGNQDSTLSSGGFLFSKNSRPMPKVWIGFSDFVDIPFTAGYAEVRGGLSHGWFNDGVYPITPYLHHKYAYFRFGGSLPVNFQYGLDHVAQWGGYSPSFGKQPATLSDFARIFVAGAGGNDAPETEQINALGNHIISQSMKLQANISDYRVSTYWQNLSEDSPFRLMWQTMNVSDGLWGFTVRNDYFPIVKALLYEYINTTDQSGPYHDKDGIVYGGDDSYFQNGVYTGGWNYFGAGIGLPFISSPYYNTDGYTQTTNSRVKAHHWGVEGEFSKIYFRTMASFTTNFGLYNSAYRLKQQSYMAEFSGKIPNNADSSWLVSLGADFGQLRGNSIGVLVGIRKSGLLFRY